MVRCGEGRRGGESVEEERAGGCYFPMIKAGISGRTELFLLNYTPLTFPPFFPRFVVSIRVHCHKKLITMQEQNLDIQNAQKLMVVIFQDFFRMLIFSNVFSREFFLPCKCI